MSSPIKIRQVHPEECYQLSVMVGGLLNEIMEAIGTKAFHFDRRETEVRARQLLLAGKYWVFVAEDTRKNEIVGFVSLYESYALYSEGAYGTIPELYVKENWRSRSVGHKLLMRVKEFATAKNWRRIEVTTPPLPQFDKTLSFYQSNGFSVTGGKKLKADIHS